MMGRCEYMSEENLLAGNGENGDNKPLPTASTESGDAAEKPKKSPESSSKKKKAPPKKRKKKTTKQLLIGILIKVGVIALAVWLLFTFVLGIHIHYGNNMHPSVRDGDLIFSFRLQQPYINAAVLYEHDGKTTVGRVIALEGSTISIGDNGEFTVNGIVPSEEVFYPTFADKNSDIKYPYTVPEGKVFILNDFREDTNDSRSFGAVDTKDLKGPLLFTMRRRGF